VDLGLAPSQPSDIPRPSDRVDADAADGLHRRGVPDGEPAPTDPRLKSTRGVVLGSWMLIAGSGCRLPDALLTRDADR
jgi:hypothetical protein